MNCLKLVCILLFAWTVSFQVPACDGFVVLEDTPVYKSSSGDATRWTLRKGDIALPDFTFLDSNPVAGTMYAIACSFKQDKTSRRFKVVGTLMSGQYSQFTYGWISVGDNAKQFSYRMLPSIQGHVKPESFISPAVEILDALAFKNFRPPEIVNQFAFERPFDVVWSAIVETLAEYNFPIELLDKSSGIITTRKILDPKGNSMVCSTALGESPMLSFNVFVKEKGNATSIRLNIDFSVIKDAEKVRCYSNGALESLISSKVKEIVSDNPQEKP